MIALVANLQTKDPFYVRCIKPNEIKSPMRFDDERCLHQVSLKYGVWSMGFGVFNFYHRYLNNVLSAGLS